jgi:hypothetical protein
LEASLDGVQFRFDFLSLLFLGIAEEAEERSFVSLVGISGIIKEGEDLEIFGVGDGVVFMSVALSAGHGRPHPGGERGIDAVDDSGVAELFVIRAALAVGHGIAMEGGRGQLLFPRFRQQIAGDLFKGELIKRFVGVE